MRRINALARGRVLRRQDRSVARVARRRSFLYARELKLPSKQEIVDSEYGISVVSFFFFFSLK